MMKVAKALIWICLPYGTNHMLHILGALLNTLIIKIHGLTWPELVQLGAPKMEGQFLASGLVSYFNYFKK
jgi:hypothetical protein